MLHLQWVLNLALMLHLRWVLNLALLLHLAVIHTSIQHFGSTPSFSVEIFLRLSRLRKKVSMAN